MRERKRKAPKLTYCSPEFSWPKNLLIDLVERLTGRGVLERKYEAALAKLSSGKGFFELAVETLELTLEYDQEKLWSLRNQGPILFISNHPFGVVDGICLCALAYQIDKDFKILINEALCKEAALDKHTLPIDFSESEKATKNNVRSQRAAAKKLRSGGIVIVYPAGAVSNTKGFFGAVEDWDWNPLPAALLQLGKASALPVFFHGRNSRAFQIVSQFSMTLRLAFLLWEVKNKIGRSIKIEIGEPIPWDQLKERGGREEVISYLRKQTYSLQK